MRANIFWNLESAAYASPSFARLAQAKKRRRNAVKRVGSYINPGRGVA